ncbi:YcbK family protein [Marinimicrobium sp. ARAG 43.8]|uniref:YcbK family protein n=1 Tax=Marinimicrobium sp. ARAG 43.8 TaxID=3418719 RepID=UPI003CE7662B
MPDIDWSQYPDFTPDEFRCKETGELNVDDDFLIRLQALRTEYGQPMIITSGYRSPQHSIEAEKSTPGQHANGIAVDVRTQGNNAWDLVALAVQHGFYGIGVSQKNGKPRFIHLDTRPHAQRAIWSY